MKIDSLTYKNNETGWNVKDLTLDYLTLLVGVSGIGKTRILRSILDLADIASGHSINNVEWGVVFSHNGKSYEWSGSYDYVPSDDISIIEDRKKKNSIVYENLICDGTTIIKRTAEEILFEGTKTVKLDTSKSVLELLKEESIIAPAHDAFMHIYLMDNANNGIRVSPFIDEEINMISDLDSIHKSRFLSPLEKLFLLRKNGFQEYTTIKESFIRIFPFVEDIDFKTAKLFDDHTVPVLRIKESGVESWIPQTKISSGMFRTLMQITTLELAQDGDIFLIDEFENGLGVNCIDQLADDVIDPDKDIQVIITSHHPYIINNIPFERWKVVIRDKGNVDVLSAAELKIGNHSRHDAFMQLIQTKAFKTGQR